MNINTGELVNKRADVSFIQWIDEDTSACVIFAAEDEIIAFENNGNLLWRKNLPDVIETTDVKNNQLIVVDMSGAHYKYELLDGKSI